MSYNILKLKSDEKTHKKIAKKLQQQHERKYDDTWQKINKVKKRFQTG